MESINELKERYEQVRLTDGNKVAYHKVYLTSTHWSDLRTKVLQRDGYRCVMCEDRNNLQVHHKRYDRLFGEELDDLATLCNGCHLATPRRWEDQ